MGRCANPLMWRLSSSLPPGGSADHLPPWPPSTCADRQGGGRVCIPQGLAATPDLDLPWRLCILPSTGEALSLFSVAGTAAPTPPGPRSGGRLVLPLHSMRLCGRSTAHPPPLFCPHMPSLSCPLSPCSPLRTCFFCILVPAPQHERTHGPIYQLQEAAKKVFNPPAIQPLVA